MKTRTVLTVLTVLLFGANSVMAEAVVEDNFNSYVNGSVVGQGGWKNRSTGDNFIVQDTTVLEGAKALYISGVSDSVIIKEGISLSDGIQTFYAKTENRNNWAPFSRIDFRMLRGGWDTGVYAQVALQWNGKVEYTKGGLNYQFATFNDDEWTKIDIEWRATDASARYRANDELWTDWYTYAGGGNFDSVGIDYGILGGSVLAGAHFDALGANPVPEPGTIVLLLTGLIACGFLLRRK
ncbi:MAG: hypothetical protein A2812_03035 [Candidatus Staskawiczbacteria bacterium RIFCSPHIGHO2_01_FULL_36_16]|uniref:Ice-binding protein C-terminal domain-containing protein n=1 Tax=Candidatus Staskawiczbacteria bacterium RIFCSPHIGHO2_01_FULL_36_16 TaxID=1802200 RepID=A0A1G2HJK3_9BACT|nr:MAG: hypothetical protein A2812_03035 [Candidatus Staskawiczbacteria bacterium RIFCSPHIGHO2_01_FULL_36_16]